MSVQQKIAAGLMLLSGITHPAQLLFYENTPEVREPALAGMIFFPIGLFLLTRFRLALVVAIVIPLLGGTGAVQRILTANPTAFSYFHAAIDFVVIGLCITALAKSWRVPTA
ncbi:MAG: hypothetical protein QF570_05385 [Myxococcota bacterium]|nr:hypothetical protein [Myxococcota bacterium]